MKKFLMGLLVVVMVLGLTACSPEVSSKLGDAMGKMSTNVYGIKANMVQVEKASESVDNSVSKDESGNVETVNLTKAAQVMDQISNIKGSDQKVAALKESLTQTVSGSEDAAAAAAAQAAIATSASEKKAALDASATAATNVQLTTAISNALAAVETSLTDNPTKAELATVAVISAMADALMDENLDVDAMAQKGQDALDTLKVISDFGGISLINDEILDGLLSTALSGNKSIAREEEEDAINPFIELYSDTAAAVINMITENGQFVEAKYRSFILQAQAMKAAYDMISASYIPDPTKLEDYDKALLASIDHGLGTEDLVKYLISWLFTEINEIDKTASTVFEGGVIVPILTPAVTNNYVYMTDLKTAAQTNAQFNTEGIGDELLAHLISGVCRYLGDDSNDTGSLDKLASDFNTAFTTLGSTLSNDFFRFLGTTVVIIVDANWSDSLFSLVSMATGGQVENVSGVVTAVQALISEMVAGMLEAE